MTTVNFEFERSTKGSHRFKEVDAEGNSVNYQDQVVGTLYVKKSFLGDKAPKGLVVEVDVKR